MPEPTECPACDEIVDTLTVEGICDDCWRKGLEFDRRMGQVDVDEPCAPDFVVRAPAPVEA